MSTRRRLIVHNPGPYGPYGAPAAREAPRQAAVGAPYGGHPGAGYAHDAALLNHNLVSAPIGVPPHLARIAQANALGMAMRANQVGAGREFSHPQVYDHYAPPAEQPSDDYLNSAVQEWNLDEVAGGGPQFHMTEHQAQAAAAAGGGRYNYSRDQSDAGQYMAARERAQRHHDVANAEGTLASLEAHARPFVQSMGQNVDIMSKHSYKMLSEAVGTLVSLAETDVKLSSIHSHTNRFLTHMTNDAYGLAQQNGIAGAQYYVSCAGEIARKAVDMQPFKGDMTFVSQSVSPSDTGAPNGVTFETVQPMLARVHQYVEGNSSDTAYREMRRAVVDAHLMSICLSLLVTTMEEVGDTMSGSSRPLSHQLAGFEADAYAGRAHSYRHRGQAGHHPAGHHPAGHHPAGHHPAGHAPMQR
jgi:hypothetical protein